MEDVATSESEYSFKIGRKQDILMHDGLGETWGILLNRVVSILEELSARLFVPILAACKLGWGVLNEHSCNEVAIVLLV